MSHVESILVAIGYSLMYGSLVFLACGAMYAFCELLEWAIEFLGGDLE